MLELSENAEYTFIAIAPRSTLGWIELNRDSFTILICAFKLHIYAKLNCLE